MCVCVVARVLHRILRETNHLLCTNFALNRPTVENVLTHANLAFFSCCFAVFLFCLTFLCVYLSSVSKLLWSAQCQHRLFIGASSRSLPLLLPATLSVGFAQLPACLPALCRCRCPLSLSHRLSCCAVVVTRFERKRAARQQLSCACCVFAGQLAVVLSAKRPPYLMPLSLAACVCVCMWVQLLLLYLQLLQVERSKTADVSRLLFTTRCRCRHPVCALFAHQLFHSTRALFSRLCPLARSLMRTYNRGPAMLLFLFLPVAVALPTRVCVPVCAWVCVFTCIRDFCAGWACFLRCRGLAWSRSSKKDDGSVLALSLSLSISLAGKQAGTHTLPALHTLPSCSHFVPHYCAACGCCAAATSAAATAAFVVAPRENAPCQNWNFPL